MKTTAKIFIHEKYLPNSRCKNFRTRGYEKEIEIEFREVTLEKFPMAMITKNHGFVDEEWKDKIFTEYRCYEGNFYTRAKKLPNSSKSLTLEDISFQLGGYLPYPYEGDIPYVSGKSVLLNHDEQIQRDKIQEQALNYLIFNGEIWERTGEPMYEVVTFGLGHNHGGTSMFVTNCYNENISYKNYFNALCRNEAIEYARQVAAKRGDTDSLQNIGDVDIRVLKPEYVKADPEKEHGDGDTFLNNLETLCEAANSSFEAGLLTLMATAEEIRKG